MVKLVRRRIGGHSTTTTTRTLVVLIVLAAALAAPVSASAIAVPMGVPSSLTMRTHYVGPTAHLAAVQSTMSGWLVGAIAAAIIVGTLGLALWTEHQRPDNGQRRDDSGLDGGDDSGGGGSKRPHPPAGPGGTDLHWSTFEAEFWDYVGRHERRRELAGRR